MNTVSSGILNHLQMAADVKNRLGIGNASVEPDSGSSTIDVDDILESDKRSRSRSSKEERDNLHAESEYSERVSCIASFGLLRLTRSLFLVAVLPYSVSTAAATAQNPAADYRTPFGGAYIPSDQWSDATNVHDFPTDAFGQITFDNEDEGSLKPSKCVAQ